MVQNPVCRLFAAVCLMVVFASPAAGGIQHRVDPHVVAPLHAHLEHGARVRVEGVPLVDGETATLEVEAFEVWAPGADIKVFGADGAVLETLPLPSVTYFKGRVAGRPDSLVFLSRSAVGVEGLVYTDDRKFAIGSRRRARGSMETELVVEESTVLDDFPSEGTFSCELDQTEIAAAGIRRPFAVTNGFGEPVTTAAPTGTQRSLLHLAIETDYELFTRAGSSSANVTTFIGNLIGAASTIYERDLLTELRLSYLGIYTSSNDPFNVVPGMNGATTVDAMNELGDRWQNSPPTTNVRSAVAMLSGKSQTAGVAWVNTLCNSSYYYSYNGGIAPPATLTVPNPDAPGYAVPNSNYWPLLQFTHELGHNVGSSHTHCVSLTSAQKTQYNVTRNYVDQCYSGGGSGCFVGTTSLPVEKGTIMSYCHLVAGGSATRFTFGQPNEASEVIRTNMRGNMASRTPALSAIATPASIAVGVSAAASVSNLGHTYSWSITNGTFSGGGTTAAGAAVTFIPSASPVTLKVIATNTNGCAVTDTKVLTTEAVTLAPPANVVATATSATSVAISWSGVAGAAAYEVHRSSGGGVFTQVGAPAATSFNDTSAAAGTAYLYRVRATASGSSGAFSAVDLATTVIFTDPSLVPGVTAPKSEHVSQLLTAVNAVRRLGGLSDVSFGTPGPGLGASVRKAHLDTLRTGLNQGLSAISSASLSFESIVAGTTVLRAAHIIELRNGVR